MVKIIRKVWEAKGTKQLLITIPLNQGVKTGDYVEVKKVK
jgi:hypothetical protein